MSSVAGFCSVTDARFSRALQPGLGSVSQGDVSALPALPETGGKAIFGSGRVSQGPLPSSRPVRAYRRGGSWPRVSPTFFKEKAPPYAAALCFCAASPGSHLIIQSSNIHQQCVHTRNGLQVRESPAVAVDACHRVLGAHRRRGSLLPAPDTARGGRPGHLPARPAEPGLSSFFPRHLSPRQRLRPRLNLP